MNLNTSEELTEQQEYEIGNLRFQVELLTNDRNALDDKLDEARERLEKDWQ